jgi:glucose-6-phosphate isomerase
MPAKPIKPIRYDYEGVFLPKTGLDRSALKQLAPKLDAARAQVLAEAELWASGGAVPAEMQPLDAGFHMLPERMLTTYKKVGATSELGRILRVAARLRDQVDRVVVLGIGGSYMGAKALMDGCCEPYFNELSRSQRGSRPRMYFEGNNVDNDASAGLLSLLNNGRPANSVDDRWAIVVISKSGGTLETAVALRQFLEALKNSIGASRTDLGKWVIPVTGSSGKLFDLSKALGCPEIFSVPDGVGGRFSVFSAVGLLPAAILGIDIVRMLEAASAMNKHFATAPVGQNAVLDYVGISHLMEKERGANIRVLQVWSKSLECTGLWYDQLLAESLGKAERGATPLTAVNTRDLHSRAQQPQEGRRDKLFTNVIVDSWRHDPLKVGLSELNQDSLNDLAEKTMPELMSAAIAGTNEAYHEDGRCTADIHLSKVDEAALGQLFQMLMLATVVEGRLMGINPYGQPGVEKYKQNMSRILGCE